MPTSAQSGTSRVAEESWRLVERYVIGSPRKWWLVFRKGSEVIEISVAEDAWRIFDA